MEEQNMQIYIEPSDLDYIIIKIKEQIIQERGSVYETVRSAWHAKLSTAEAYKYVLAVVEGVVREVYEVEKWQLNKERERIEFVGHVAPQHIVNYFKGKTIPEKYRVKGLASPFLYKRVDDGEATMFINQNLSNSAPVEKAAKEKAAPKAEKAKAEKAKAEKEDAKAKAELEAVAKAQAEAEAAKAELARLQAEAAKAKAEAEAIKAKAEAEAAKAKAEAEKAKATAEAEKAKAAAEAAQAEAEKATAAPVSTAAPANKGNKGALPGLFSVAANKKVRFSMGNLQFNPKKYEWRFALHQYDVIGAENSKIAPNYDGWIDLFGYGTSGYMGLEPTEVSTTSEQYPHQNIANTNYDWGVYNPISNGGNKEGLWRTLTANEWNYLFNIRPNATKLRAKACVNGINGAIVLPDDFYEHRVRVPFDNTPNDYSGNNYNLAQWAILEEAGAFFLPTGGCRDGCKISSFSSYQTSTVSPKSSGCCSYFVNIDLFNANVCSTTYYARSVRLVQDVK